MPIPQKSNTPSTLCHMKKIAATSTDPETTKHTLPVFRSRVFWDMLICCFFDDWPMAPPTFAEVRLAAEIAAFKRSLGMNAETEKPLGASLGSGVMARV